jgi:hypothetical protein
MAITPSPLPHYLSALSGDFVSRTNVFRMIREFARFGGINRGYYMELGCMNGDGIVIAYRQLRGLVTDVYGFDTFSGHPKHQAVDDVHKEWAPALFEGNYAAVSRDFAETLIHASTLLPKKNIHLIEGKFSDTLPKFDKSSLADKEFPIAIMVDCDIYTSALDAFGFITDIIQTGTWLLIDDYWNYRGDPKLGVRRAFDEWIRDNGRVGATLYDSFNAFSQAYICYVK